LRKILGRTPRRSSITPWITCTSDPQLAGISISFFPIVRMSAQMHYCKDENLVLLNPIDNAIGEPVYKTARISSSMIGQAVGWLTIFWMVLNTSIEKS
jgi:hypothetical protein